MTKSFKNTSDLIGKVYTLAKPYGRKKLIGVSFLSLCQGVFQVIGVTSIFPFLALGSNPALFRESEFGARILSVLPEVSNDGLLMIAGVFAILMLALSNGINLGAEFARTRYAHGFGHSLRTSLLRKIATRPYTEFLQQNSGVLLKKVVGDVMQFTRGILLPLLDSLARLVTIFLLISTLFLIQPEIAIGAILAFGSFYLIVFRIFGKWRNDTADGLKAANQGAIKEAQQMLGGIKPVKVHRAEEAFIDRYSVHSKRQAELSAWVSIVSNGPRYLLEPLAFGGIVFIVLAYVAHGQDLGLIVPTLGVMALACYRLLPSLQLLYAQFTQLATARHSLEEIYDEFLAVEQSLDKDRGAADGTLKAPPRMEWESEISLNGLSFRYPGAEQSVIYDLNLLIPKNSSLGIIGTTGSGKSTLVDLILGLHFPTAGRIMIDDVTLGPDNRRAWRGGIGYVPQDIFLIDDSVAANIALGVPKDLINQEALNKAARAAQILTFIQKELPQRWDTVVGERGVRLSGGQRQRIGLARALYHNPELLILDEATSALDNQTEAKLIEAINELQGEMTIIMIAHRLSTIHRCEQVLDLGELKRKHPQPA